MEFKCLHRKDAASESASAVTLEQERSLARPICMGIVQGLDQT